MTTTRYTIAGDSSLAFEARSNLHDVNGSVSQLTGFVEGDVEAQGLATKPLPKMHVEFRVDALKSGNALLDQQMWKLIDNKRFPMVAADLKELAPADGVPGRFAALGDITLAGKQKRYSGDMTITSDGTKVTVDGEITVDIRDFGLRPPSLIFVQVAPEVKVRLHLVARGG